MNRIIVSVLLIMLVYASGSAQSLSIHGMGLEIPGDGSNAPSFNDGTRYSQQRIGSSAVQSFLLTSLEQDKPDLEISAILVDSPHFAINSGKKIKIRPGQSESLEISFNPQSGGYHEATVTFLAKKRGSVLSYSFNIAGEAFADLMISQYLEDGASDALEVVNLSAGSIGEGSYFIGIFQRQNDIRRGPSRVIDLEGLSPGESKLVATGDLFDGNEVIVLSTSRGRSCYEDRVDLLGMHGTDWGSARSLVKGACSSNSANLEFEPGQWTELSTQEAREADPRQNIYLGRYDGSPLEWNGAEWSNGGLPDRTRKVIISGPYHAALGGFEACDLEVRAGLDFNRGTRNSVVLNGDLEITGTFEIGDQESLVMYDPQAIIAGKIKKVERSTYRNHKHDLTYWASPVEGASISNVFQGVSPSRIYQYDQARSRFSEEDMDTYWDVWQRAQGTMEQARGYVSEGVTGTTGHHQVEFHGTPNNGDIFMPLHFWEDSNPDNDWNLIGNPYPSAIDIELFFDANRGLVDPAVYLWTHSTPLSNGNSGDYASDDYATYNYTGGTGIGSGVGGGPVPEKNIGSAQGFFVRALGPGSAVFRNDMRMVDANDQFFKGENLKGESLQDMQKDRIWLNLTTDQGGFNQLLIGFFEEAGPGVDPGYDAVKFEGGNPISFFSRIDEQRFVIQAREPYTGEQVVPIGFSTYVAPRNFQIEIERGEGALNTGQVLLHDKLLHVVHDLYQGPYSFRVEEVGDQPDRFSLEFRGESASEPEGLPEGSNIEITSKEGRVQVRNEDKVGQIRIYNVSGILIHESFPGREYFEVELTGSGRGQVYLIEIIESNGTRHNKKVILQ